MDPRKLIAVFAIVAWILVCTPLAAQCVVETLGAPDAEPWGELGYDVALDGDLILLGDRGGGDLGPASGSTLVFERGAQGWSFVSELHASDGAAYAYFGTSTALSGGIAVVGATGANAAYVFELVGGAWTETTRLAPGSPASMSFGSDVAIEGDRILVGAPYDDSPGGAEAGAVYVFERDPVLGWIQVARLTATDGTIDDHLGEAVALNGDVIAAGARTHDTPFTNVGAVYVFERDPVAGWLQTAKLTGVQAYDVFGEDVALDGDTLAVGTHDNSAPVYQRIGGVWTLTETLLQPEGSGGDDLFGWSVDVDGSRVLVGARKNGGQGAAYLFGHTSGSFAFMGKLVHPDASSMCGEAVALAGLDVLVGDRDASTFASGAGAAFVHVLAGGAGLTGAPDELAIDAGGTQELVLTTCPPLVGATYLALGTLSGTAPGIALGGGLVLPLNPDGYLQHTLLHGGPPLVGAGGSLDLAGAAYPNFALAPGSDPALAGLTAHHACVVLGPLTGVVAVTDAVPLAFAATKEVWTVDDDAPADFAEISAAIASPAVKPGDTLLVYNGGYASFDLTKPLRVVAPEGQGFYAPYSSVHDVTTFTLAGLGTRSLTIENVTERGTIDGCAVGVPIDDGAGGLPWLGSMVIRNSGEVLVSNTIIHGTDACYPFFDLASPGVWVEGSRAAFVDCEVYGGNGAGEGCDTHYPTAGEGLVAIAGSDVMLTASSLVGGTGPFNTTMPAVSVDGSVVEVRGSSWHRLEATPPAAPIAGTPGAATVSGVTLVGAPLPAWVVQPVEARPYARLVGGTTTVLELYGPVGASALAVAATAPELLPDAFPGLGAVWLDPASILAQGVLTLLGQDAAASVLLPSGFPAPGTTLLVQAYIASSPAGHSYLTPPAQLVARQ